MKSFAVTGLPRSRTAWLSMWLSSFPGVLCIHDAMWWATPEQIMEIGRDNDVDYMGVSDSAFVCMPDLLDSFDRILYVKRDRSEVVSSLEKAFGKDSSNGIYLFPDSAPKGSLVVPFDEVDESLGEIAEHLIPGAEPGILASQVERMKVEVLPGRVFKRPGA